MFKDITLGKFSYKNGGEIYLAPGDNMEYGLETASCMHELFHANLALTTNIGILMHLIELAIGAEKDDLQCLSNLINVRDILYESTRSVQEVYANSQELLWVEKYYGIEVRNQVYNKKTSDYKKYLCISESIWRDQEKTIEERKKLISNLCASVLNVDILEEMFWKQLKDGKSLKETLEERLISVFKNQKNIENARLIDREDVIALAKMRFKHISDLLEDGFKYSEGHLDHNLTELLLENIKTFDFSELEVTLGDKYNPKSGAICILKVLDGRDGSIDIRIVQHYTEKGVYEIVAIEKSLICDLVKDKGYVIVPDNEFLIDKDKAEIEEINDKIVIVLFDVVKEFKECIQKVIEFDEVYIGDINAQGKENFFTVIFFRKRKCDKAIYMLPTLSMIAKNIYEELQITNQVKHPDKGMGFYNIFSAFDDWSSILSMLKEIISFVTRSKGNILFNDNPCSKLLNSAKYEISNNIFKIVGENYFFISAALPTIQTKASPFWILMEFENGENNGNVKCEKQRVEDVSGKTRKGIVYFCDKSSAENYRKRMVKENQNLKNYQVVGMDELFWTVIKKMLKQLDFGMIFAQNDTAKGIYNDVEQFEYLRLLKIRG